MPIAINGSGTITGISAGGLPDATITQAELATGVAGNGPAFSAYKATTQVISATTNTKIAFDAEDFDTANCFDPTTNYRFTPNVAGYYQVDVAVQFLAAGTNASLVILYKNGANIKYGNYSGTALLNPINVISTIVYMNGTTDYLEVYANNSISSTVNNSSLSSYFQAALVRAA